MATIMETMMAQVGGGNLSALSQAVGADEGSTQRALGAAMPLLLAALAKNAAKPDGAASLHHALAADHDGGLLDNVTGFFGQGDVSPGQGILRHVLGGRQATVEKGIGKASGLDAGQASKLLAMAAPLLMAALGKQRRQQSLDPSSLGRVLRQESESVQSAAPQLGGLTRLLDADGDGSVTDDLANLGQSMLGRLFGR